jgi:hypothetical protein
MAQAPEKKSVVLEKEDFFEAVNLADEQIEDILGMGRKMTIDLMKNFGIKFELHGVPKVGKTSWAMKAVEATLKNPKLAAHTRWLIINGYITLPVPVLVIDTEKRSNRLVNVFHDQDIIVWNVRFPDKSKPYREDPVKTLEMMWKILLVIYKKFKTGTIVIDTHTYINRKIRNFIQNELIRRGAPGHELGEFIRLMPQDHSVRNDIWDYVIALLLDMPQHVVFISRDKEEWGKITNEKGETILGKTGDMEPSHYKELPYEVDVELNYQFQNPDQNNPLSKVQRVMELEEFAWSGISPETQKWVNPDFVDVLNYVTKFSHRTVIKQNFEAIKKLASEISDKQKKVITDGKEAKPAKPAE